MIFRVILFALATAAVIGGLAYACWANNHNGWAKAKKSNKRLAKRRLKNELRKELVYSASDKQVGE